MKRIIKNNYQPNSVRVIKSVFEFNPEFDLEAEEFSVRGLYRTIDQLEDRG